MKRNAVRAAVAAMALGIAGTAGIMWPRLRRAGGDVPPPRPASLLDAINGSFQLVDASEDRFSKRMNFRNGEQVLQLEMVAGLDPESAQTLIEDGIMGVHALHAQALSAYPENLSKQVSAPERFRPEFFRKTIDGVSYHYFLLYANARMVYGAADENSINQRSLLGWIYCDVQRTVYRIRIFAPLDHPGASLESCFLALPCG